MCGSAEGAPLSNKRPKVVLRLIAAVGIVSMLMTGLVTSASASPNPGGGLTAVWDTNAFPPIFGAIESATACAAFGGCTIDAAFADGAQEVYFPAVGNGDDFGLGANP